MNPLHIKLPSIFQSKSQSKASLSLQISCLERNIMEGRYHMKSQVEKKTNPLLIIIKEQSLKINNQHNIITTLSAEVTYEQALNKDLRETVDNANIQNINLQETLDSLTYTYEKKCKSNDTLKSNLCQSRLALITKNLEVEALDELLHLKDAEKAEIERNLLSQLEAARESYLMEVSAISQSRKNDLVCQNSSTVTLLVDDEDIDDVREKLQETTEKNAALVLALEISANALKELTKEYVQVCSLLPLEWGQTAENLTYTPIQDIDANQSNLWTIDHLLNGIEAMNTFFLPRVAGVTLGQGAHGVVTVRQDKKTHRKYAVKTVRLNKKNPKSVEKVMSEMKVLAYAKHKNILAATEFFRRQNKIEMVLPLFDASLFTFLSGVHVIEFPVAVVLVGDLVDGLQYLHHCMGLCHRDIKPGNLLLSIERAVLVIADFDLAVACSSPLEGLTEGVGTEGYIAPEVYATVSDELASFGTACDIFSGGVVMREIVQRIRVTNCPLLAALTAICDSCTRPNPSQRPTAQQIQQSGVFETGDRHLLQWFLESQLQN